MKNMDDGGRTKQSHNDVLFNLCNNKSLTIDFIISIILIFNFLFYNINENWFEYFA